MYYKKIALLLSTIIPFFGHASQDNMHLPEKPFNKAVGRLQEDIIQYVSNRYQLICYTPIISAPSRVFLSYGFRAHIVAQIEEPKARKLVVETAEFLLQRVNKDPVLRKYMEKERFDFSDIAVHYTFHDKDGAMREPPHLTGIDKLGNSHEVEYKQAYFTKDEDYHVAKRWSESFEKTKERIRQEN